jgi:hypothetical protein
MIKKIFLLFVLFFPVPLLAEDVLQTADDFLQESFDNAPPEQKVIWITKKIRPQVNHIMEDNYPLLKIRYWKKGSKTVWILDNIGKVKPITTGIIVNHNKIEFLKVLTYRESHGWEVKHNFFTDQFKNAKLSPKHKLDKRIDNISGATMSVDAIHNVSKLALFLHSQVIDNEKEDKNAHN